MKPVTDPAILAALEGGGGKPVTDPALLAQLEGEKKPEGTDWMRQAALLAKAAFQGVTSLPAMFADAQDMPRAVSSKALGVPYQSPSERLQGAVDSVTYSPATKNERLATDFTAGATGALTGGPGKLLTAIAGGAGGVGGGAAREAGGGAVSQIAAALLASLVPGGAAKVAKTGVNILDSAFVPGGGKRAAVRATANLVDDKDAIAEALLKARSGQTAAQAAAPAASAEFSALERIARENDPSKFQAVDDAQKAARAATIKDIAKTPEALAEAKAARSAAADVNYGEAYKAALKADPELAQMAANPYFKDALPAAAKLAKARGVDPKTNLTEFLQFVKEGLDKQLSKTGDDALEKTAKETVAGLKTQLLAWMDAKNPAFGKARTEFAAQSKPINKMVVGAELEKALTSGTGKERVGAFTNAVDNAGRIPELRRKSGANRFGSAADVLDEGEMGKVREVADDLRTDVRVDELASAGMPKARREYFGEMDSIGFPQMLSRPVMVANAILDRLEGSGAKRTTEALSELMRPEGVKDFGMRLKDYSKEDIRALLVEALMAGGRGGIAQRRAEQ